MMATGMMLLISSHEDPECLARFAGLCLLILERPESDLTEHPITQQFHNTKVTKVIWGKRVFTKQTVG